MCKRRVDEESGWKEPLAQFFLRWVLEGVTEHPSAVLSVVCMLGCGWLYHDMSSLMERQGTLIERQTESYIQLTNELREIKVRVQTIEQQTK